MNRDDAHIPPLALQPLPGFSSFSQPLLAYPISQLHPYIMLAVVLNFGLLFLKGYSQDLGYWQDWVRQLSQKGYDGFDGNYPPVYIHWLYLVGKFYSLSGIPLEHNDLLKFLTQFPVMLCHCVLTLMVFRQLQHSSAKPLVFHGIMGLTVVNPAILVNGPVWGQVDLIPAVMVYGSLLAACSWRYAYLAIPLFALALLTKFQTIAFAPVLGFLFFNKTRQHLLGIVIAIALGILIFMPSILAGHFWQSFRQAYIDTLGQYPMTTFNAANLWILLTGNTVPDSILLFGIQPDSALAPLFVAKHFGMVLFALTSLVVFVHGLYFLIRTKACLSNHRLLTYTLFAATLCALAFFVLLPAMHERYLFPAAIMALAYCAAARRKILYPVLISITCALNMLIILQINGSEIWDGLAWISLALLVAVLLDHLTQHFFSKHLRRLAYRTYQIRACSLWFLLAATGGMLVYFQDRYVIHDLELKPNQVLLTDLPLIHARQDHGSLKVNRSFDGNPLSVAKRRYARGLGTHSRSDIRYQLPPNAESFHFMAALDDEVGTADVQFSVWGDDKLLWESAPLYGYERHIPTQVLDVRGVTFLTLKVAPLKDDKWDHANWINTVITLRQDETAPASPSP